MTELTITIDEERLEQLRKRAEQQGTTVDELLLQGVDQVLAERERKFKQILDEMLVEDAELFRRLA